MSFVLLLVIVGLSAFAAVFAVTRLRQERQRYRERPPDVVVPVNLMDNDNAVLVAEGRGRLVFANPTARKWFRLEEGDPNLELMARIAQPSDTFMELFSKEGQASFRVGMRRVDATSHYVPSQGTSQLVVVLRELVTAYNKEQLDPVQAMTVVGEIAQTISGSLKLDETLASILNSIAHVINFDAGEITLWDEDLQILRPLGRSGDYKYFERLDSTDGVYHLDDSFSGWIARYRQPLLISDISSRPDVRPKIKDYPFLAFVGLPLAVSDRFIGTLELASRTRAAFDHEDMALLQAVAGQAAIAIENARLYQSQTERVIELSGLQQIAGAMASLRDTRQMYAQLASRIAGLINVEMCGILLYDRDSAALVGQPPFYGVPDAIVAMYRIPMPAGSLALTIWNGREWWYTNSVKTDEIVRQTGLLSLAEAVGVRTTALVPMSIGDRRFGAVQASNKRDGSGFSENDMRLLAVFASQAAIVVENARLYDEEQRRAEELGGLQQISQAISVLRDTGELYGQINERIAKLMKVQMCGILLHDETQHMLISQTPFYGVSDDLVRYYQIDVGPDSKLGKLYRELDFWISNDLRTESLARENGLDKLAALLGVRQTLIAPLIVGGNRIGIVQVSNKLDASEFTEEDARILSIFGAQAAVIIDNARLYRQMRERADEAEELRRIAEASSSNLPLDEIFKTVAYETTQLLACDVCMIGLLDDRTGQLTFKPEWSSGLDGLTEAFNIDAYAPGFAHSAVISRRAFLSNDLRNDGRVLPVYRAAAERFDFNAVVQVPLVVQERGIGELTAASRGDKEYGPAHLGLLTAVAAQVAAAVERQRLYQATDEDLRARIQELDALTRVSNELNMTVQLERILDVIRHEAQRTTGAETATVVLLKVQPEGTANGEPIVDQRFGAAKLIAGLAPIEGEALNTRALVAVSDYTASELEPQPPQARSAVAVPIIYSDEQYGVIHIYSPTIDWFALQAQDFVRALANQAAIAVGNQIRYNEQLDRSELLKQRADQLSEIFELSRMLRTEDSLEGVLEAVAHGITEAVGFNLVVVSLVDRTRGVMRRVAQAGMPIAMFREMQMTEPPLHHLENLLKPRYQISSSYFLPAEHSDDWLVPDLPIVTHTMSVPKEGPRAWDPEDLLLVPLRSSAGDLIGLISLDDPRDGKRPTRQTVEALEIFASQAAFAIENYRLVQAFQAEAESARRERDRLEQLYLVATEIQRAADVPTRLKVVADGIRAAGWGRVAITLRDQKMEPRETITAGYADDEEKLLKLNLLPGIIWSQRLSDPDFRKYRIGQAYYLRGVDPWITENKLIAGSPDTNSPRPAAPPSDKWNSLDTVYLPLYGLDASRLIGIISMDSPGDGRTPTESALRPIELFAGQASSAIENTRLYEETIRAAQQEARINEVMEAVASTLDLHEIIQGVAGGLQQMIAFTRMTVALVNEGANDFEVLRVSMGLRGDLKVEPGIPIPAENSAIGLAVRESVARVYHLTEADRTTEYSDLKAWRDSGERTSLVVPMVAGGRTVGALHMGSELTAAFGFEDNLPLVARMSNLTAIAIENARLLRQTLDRERFSAALSRVGQSINAMLNMSSVLDTVCEESINILSVEGAYVWLVEGNEMVGLAARGAGSETFVGKRLPLDSDTIDATVVRDRTPIYVNYVGKTGSRWRTIIQSEYAAIHAILGVPLIREDKAIGAIIFVQADPEQLFTNEDIEQASAFALQASIAIENARLYQETLGLQAFSDAIVQSIQQGIVVLEKDMRVRLVNAYVRRTFGWTDEAIGKFLFEYRPKYESFLTTRIENVLRSGHPDTQYDVKQTDERGQTSVLNFYVYPLLQRDVVNGIVLLIEDVTTRAALEADIETRARQLSVLTEASGQLTATLQTQAVVKLVLDQLERILDFDSVTLWLREDTRLVIRAARGYTDGDRLIGIEAEISDSALFRELASRGQVLNIPDVTQDPRFPGSQDRPTRSWLGVSLVSKGNLAGLLVLEKAEVGYYTPTMEQLALTFANQVAISLENARLFQETTKAAEENTRLYQETALRARELDQQTKRLALLNRVSNALTQSLDLENIFDVTLREATEVLGADRAIALLIDSQQGRARLAFEFPRGDRPPIEDFPLESQTQIDELRKSLVPVVIQDVLNDPRTASNRETLKQHNVVSMVILPLTIGGQLMGTLAFETIGKRREFTPEQVEIAQAISSQAAITVQSANLFEQSLIRTRELELLFEATQSTSITLVLDEVYSNTVMQMMYAMQADGCALLYWDNVENTLIVARDINEQEGTAPTDAPGTVYNLSDYPTHDRALRARQVILMRADDPNLNQSERQLLETRKVHSRVIVPMVVREQSIGVLEVENRNPQRIFTASEVRLARTLASQSAVAIDNAKLQTETASKLEELFVINELSTSLAASIEQEQIIAIIRARLPSLIKAQMWLMALLEEDKQTVSYPIALRENKSIQIASHPLGDDEISFLFKRRSAQRLAGTELDDVLRNLNIKLRITNSRSFLGVPMISSNEVVGALVLSDEKNPRAFGFDEERILSTVGAQIGVAIQNARLFAQTRRFTAELEQAVRQRTEELQHERDRIDFLYRITTGLAASLDIEIELDRALAMMAQAVGASMGAILGIDQISDNLIYRATHNLPTSETERMPTFSQREGLAGWVIQSQQSVVVDDAQTDPRWLRISAFDEQPRSVISALLEANEDILGVVMLYSDQPGLFTDDHLRLVMASAKQIASAMNNAELYSLIREQAERLAAMVRREQVDSTKNLAIVESIADGVMVADQNGDVTQFNSAAERILGLQRKQVIGSHITSLAGLYASAGGRRWLDAINRWIADPTEHRPGEELQVQLELDNNRYVSVVLSPVNMGDQFLGTVSVFRDITREVEVDRMKSEFVATVSHELRTPMTSIKGYADLLLLGAAGQVTDQQQKFLSTIKANADRLAELVNKLLDISRLDRGAVKLNMQSTDVEEVIDVSVRHLRSRVENERKSIDVAVNLPPDLPFIRADFDKITQVLNNLVDNAFNYTYPGGSITINAQADERSVVISVSDTGIGIPKDKQDLIWNRFFRDEEQHLVMETSGAGLGLSIVKEYVSMHDGEIWLESEVGKGTTFHVRIPTMAVTV